jgi:hypothetical protein
LGEREFKSSVDHIKFLIVFFKVTQIIFRNLLKTHKKVQKPSPKTLKLVKTSPKTAKEPEIFYDGYPNFFFRVLKILKMGVDHQINNQPFKTMFIRFEVILHLNYLLTSK